MAPQKDSIPKTSTQSDPYADMPDTSASGSDPYADMPDSTFDSLTANPKNQGTYKMLAPAGSDIKSGIMVPYGNINAARQQGFSFDPHSGDDTRYAHDLFTELKGKGQAPPVHRLLSPTWTDANTSDQSTMQKYGVIPTPAPGSIEWFKNIIPSKEDAKFGGMKLAQGTINSAPGIGAGVADIAVGVPGAATGPGDLALVAAANAAGAATGEGVKQFLNAKLFGETMTPKDRAKSLAEQAVLGGVLGPGGRLVAKPLGKLADYLGETVDASDKAGFRMLPSEAHASKPTVFETYPKGSIFTSGTMAKWRELQNQETEKAALKLADDISATSLSKTGSREEAGNVIRKGIESHMDDFAKKQNVVYRQIEKQADAAGTQVPRKDLVDFAKKELGRINRVKGETGGGGPTDSFKKTLEDIIANPNKSASYTAMKDFRTSLLAAARSQNSLMSGPEQGVLDSMAKIVGNSIEDGLKNSSNPSLAAVWRSANDVTREEKENFVRTLVKNLADKKNPEDIALVLRGNSPSAIAPIGIQETRDAMSVIPNKLIPGVQKQILLDTIYEATGKGTQSFDEGLFSKKILQIGDERGVALFGQQWPKIREFSELLNKIKESGGLSGATLSNPEIVKQVSNIGLATVVSAVSGFLGRGESVEAAGIGGLIPVAGSAALWKTVAAALTHPETAEKFLNAMRFAARVTPYGADVGYNATKKMHNTINDYIKQSVTPTPNPAAPTTTPIGGQSSAAPGPKELLQKAKGLNPVAQGQTAFNHVAVNPATGHRIGSNGNGWFDIQTGAKVA